MRKITWELKGGLTDEEIKKIHDFALRLIEKIGILIPSENILKMIPQDKNIFIKNNRVYIKPEKIEELFGPFPKKQKEQNKEIKFYVSGYSLRCYDLYTGEIRKPTLNDLIIFTKIAHTLGAYGCALVFPSDLPQKLAEIATYKFCLDVSDRIYGAGIFSDNYVFDIVQEIICLIEGKYEIGMHMISPMAFDKFLIENASRYFDKKTTFSVGTMPMIGATSPVDFFSSIAQSIAEVIGGASILKILSPNNEVYFSPFVYPFDMKYGSIVFGGPDFIKLNLLLYQIGKFYGIEIMAKVFNTMGKYPGDAQVGFSSAGVILSLLMGFKMFGWAGMCCIDEIASIEQVIIQYEILKSCLSLLEGVEFDENKMNIELMEECILKENTFLTHPETLQNYKRNLFVSEIFSNETFNIWEKNGKKSIWQKAREKAIEILNKHNFKRDEKQSEELNKIWEKAVKKLK
ncbi:MAG: trimethylamine methyltransferase family protein [Candidatus Omnitrophica bacterium]|nr:trimethylamine methyltransferase family protein [Candidatus Omnitrophota bacterium]MCM8808347.1 trimethylamine methyltransferase family protein [Candidatus Omnitrophota bacterium]